MDYGLQAIYCMDPKIWVLVPKEMKQVTILNKFKTQSKFESYENVPVDSLELTLLRNCSCDSLELTFYR